MLKRKKETKVKDKNEAPSTNVGIENTLLKKIQEATGVSKGTQDKVKVLKEAITLAEENDLNTFLNEVLENIAPVYVTLEEFKSHLYRSSSDNLVFRFVGMCGEGYLTIIQKKFNIKIRFINECVEIGGVDLEVAFRHSVMMLNIYFRTVSDIYHEERKLSAFNVKNKIKI